MRTAKGASAGLVLLDGLLLATFAGVMLRIGGARLDAAALLWLFFGGAIVVTSGFVVVSLALGPDTAASNSLAVLLGSVTTSLFLLAGCYVTGTHAGTIFLCWSVLVVVAAASRRARLARQLASVDRVEIAVLGVIAVVVAVWCHRIAALLPTLQATGIAVAWSDYSIHGTEIAQFGDPHVRGLTSFLLSNQPLVVYHYGPYMLAAAADAVVNLPPWGLAASFLLPYGILLASLGVYAFVRTQTSAGVALATALALLLLPDASTYGFKNGFFSFHWLLLTAPGSGYGLAVAFTALAILAGSRLDVRSRRLWLGLAVTAAVFEFRAHVFLVFAAAVTATLLCETARVRRHARSVAIGAAIACLAVIAGVAASSRLRDAWLQFSALRPFLDAVHDGQAPTAYDGVYQALKQQRGIVIAAAAGVIALLPVALGWMSVALPVTGIAAIRKSGPRRFDFFPAWCVLVWLALVLVAPTAGGRDHTEYQHRPFVLVYAVALVWTMLFFDRAVRGSEAVSATRRLALPVTVGAVALAAGAACWNQDLARPRFGWGANNYAIRVDHGLLDAASFVRSHAVSGDTFALIPIEPTSILDDEATRFAALAGVPAYLARAGIQVRNGTDRRVVVEHRLAELADVQTTSDAERAMRTLRHSGVDFLVSLGDKCPLFDPSCSGAVFRSNRAVVYRVTEER